MRKLNPAYLQAVYDQVNACPYFSLLSMEIKMLEWGESRIEVAVQEKHLQPFGLVHGGVFSSLIDATAYWAVYPQIDEGVGMTPVEMKLNCLFTDVDFGCDCFVGISSQDQLDDLQFTGGKIR